MTSDQELAEFCDAWPDWRMWLGRDHHGQRSGWHATLHTAGRSIILAANGPAELRQRLREATRTNAAAQ